MAAVTTDLREAMEEMTLHGGTKLFLVAAPLAAARLKLDLATAGATLGDITILASDQLPALGSPDENVAMLVDASGIAADSETVVLDSADQATLQMSTTPGAGAQAVVSLFQTNSRALRASRYFGFKKFRSNCVQVISGVDW